MPTQLDFLKVTQPSSNPTTSPSASNEPDQPEDRAKHIKRTRAMSEVLGNPYAFMLASLFMLQQCGWLNAGQLSYFQGPIIFGKSAWSGTLPEPMVQKLMNAVKIERFWQLLQEAETGHATERCTPAEIVCVLQPYTLMGPLQANYADACIWAFAEMLQQHPALFEEMAAAFLKGDTPIRTPDDDTLKDLGMTLRRRVVKLAPKATKQQKPTEAIARCPNRTEPTEAIAAVQLNLLEEFR